MVKLLWSSSLIENSYSVHGRGREGRNISDNEYSEEKNSHDSFKEDEEAEPFQSQLFDPVTTRGTG